MLRVIKENPLAAIVAIMTILSMLSGGTYTTYKIFEAFEDFVTETELESKGKQLSVEILNVSIMRYEDDLARLEFKVEIGNASPEDSAEKLNIERRLKDLKQRKMALESGS
jgi:protein involved in sex pheromone biosynthesis